MAGQEAAERTRSQVCVQGGSAVNQAGRGEWSAAGKRVHAASISVPAHVPLVHSPAAGACAARQRVQRRTAPPPGPAAPCPPAPASLPPQRPPACLEVVGAHEEVGDAGAHHPHDPLVKVGGLALRHGVEHLGLHHAAQALDLQRGWAWRLGRSAGRRARRAVALSQAVSSTRHPHRLDAQRQTTRREAQQAGGPLAGCCKNKCACVCVLLHQPMQECCGVNPPGPPCPGRRCCSGRGTPPSGSSATRRTRAAACSTPPRLGPRLQQSKGRSATQNNQIHRSTFRLPSTPVPRMAMRQRAPLQPLKAVGSPYAPPGQPLQQQRAGAAAPRRQRLRHQQQQEALVSGTHRCPAVRQSIGSERR